MAGPLDFPDPLAFLDRDPLAPRRRGAAYPPLSDPEAASAIERLTSGSLSGLGYVGSLLDKMTGARAVRGTLGGHLRELLSLLPFSDTAGITDPGQITSGEDLLRRAGYDSSQGNWFERNLVGPGVEIGLDPATYLGGIGAVTKLGKGVARAGQGTKGLLPAVRAGERSLHPLVGAVELGARGLGLSTKAEPAVQRAAASAVEGAGKLGRAVNVGVRRAVPGAAMAEDLASAVGKPLLEKAALTRNALFDPDVGFTTNRIVQGEVKGTKAPALKALEGEAQRRAFDLNRERGLLSRAGGVSPGNVNRFLRQMSENLAPSLPRDFVGPAIGSQGLESLEGLAGKNIAFGRHEPIALERAAGFDPALLQDATELGYNLRQKYVPEGTRGGWQGLLGSLGIGRQKQLRTTHGSMLRRQKAVRDWEGGTIGIEDLPTTSMAAADKVQRRAIQEKLLADQLRLREERLLTKAGGGHGVVRTTPEDVQAARGRAVAMQRMLAALPPEKVGPDRLPIFAADPIADSLLRQKRAIGASTSADALFGVVPKAVRLARGLPTDVPVVDLLRGAKLDTEEGLTRALRGLGWGETDIGDALAAAAERARVGTGDVGKPFDVSGSLREMLKGYSLPAEEARSAGRLLNRWQVPEEIRPALAAADALLGWFKTGTYSLWPGSLVRNIGSGRAENLLMAGMHPLHPMYGRWNQVRQGKYVPLGIPALANLSPEDQAVAILRETAAYPHLGGHGQGDIADVIGRGAQAALPFDPLAPREGYWRTLAQIPASIREKGWRGLADIGPVSRRVGGIAEERLRMPEYMHLRAQGILPDVAADIVEKTHFDYARLSPFEKSTLKRLIPYYTYSRRNIPKQIGRAVTRPGITAGPIRFSGGGEDEGYVPEYLRSGLALPVGSPVDGTQRYLSALGLPFEEALSRLKIGPSAGATATRTAEGLLGMLRPELRMLLESATGRQFFTGRDLADLHVGKVETALAGGDQERARGLSQFLTATPASRFVSTANRLLDERKYGLLGVFSGAEGLPLTTGARLTDVDTQKWRAIDARHRLEELMSLEPQLRQSTDFYPSPEAKAAGAISPEQAYMLQLYAAMKLRAREAAQQRRVGVQVGAR